MVASVLGHSAHVAFSGITFAGMQGFLVMESADPCRMSFRKLRCLLVLALLQTCVLVTAAVLSFLDLRLALSLRLQWLNWSSPCLLALGTLAIALDMYFTAEMAYISRVFWTPFSSMGWRAKSKYMKLKLFFEVLPLTLIMSITLLLIGWRQSWWLSATTVVPAQSIAAAKNELFFSTWMMGSSVGWGLFSTATLSVLLLLINCQGPSGFSFYKHMLYPTSFLEGCSTAIVIDRESTCETRRVYNLLRLLMRNHTQVQVDDNDAKKHLCRAPLHVGNAIVGPDQNAMYEGDNKDTNFTHTLFSFVENFAILPVLMCSAIGLIRMFKILDDETLAAMRSFVDSIIVLGLVGTSIGVKMLIWSLGRPVTIHPADIGPDDFI